MKLLKTLEQRHWVTSNNNKTSATFGLFHCPYCNGTKELALSKGYNQKSCGSTECSKKAISDGYNHELSGKNIGNTKDNRTNKPYYGAFKAIYYLHQEKLSELKINNLDIFYKVSFEQYCNARKIGQKINTIVSSDGIEFIPVVSVKHEKIKNNLDSKSLKASATKVYEKKIYDMKNKILKYKTTKENELSSILESNILSTLKLSKETEVKEKTIILKIKLLQEKNIKCFIDFDFTSITSNARQKIYKLSEEQYDILKENLSHSLKNISQYVYIIKAEKNQYKIGITHNVDLRFKQIIAMNPPSSNLKLLHSEHIGMLAGKVESTIHRKLKEKKLHLHYEWFTLDTNMLSTVMFSIKNYKIFLEKIEQEEQEEKDNIYINRIKKLIELENEKYKKLLIDIEKKSEKNKNMHEEQIEKFDSIIVDKNQILKQKELIRETAEPTKDIKTEKVMPIKHGMSGTKEYHAWQQMKSQAKKVSFEPAWNDFSVWYEDFGKHKPDDNHQMIRKVGSKGFVKDNVVWVTIAEARKMQVARPVIRVSNTGSEYLYPSAIEAAHSTAKATPGHITACCRGKRKSHAGYGWKYDTIVA